MADTFRPGHADFTYTRKYGLRDPRGGGRSSARLTAPTVAAGAIAKKWLAAQHGVRVRGYMSQLGPIAIPFVSWDDVLANPFYAPHAVIVPELERLEEPTSARQSLIRSSAAVLCMTKKTIAT